VEKACSGWVKAARVFVERHQVRFVVDVQPLAAGRRDLLDEEVDEGARDAAPLVGGVDDGVEEEGVKAAVPAGVHEADQRVTAEGADPGQAVPFQAYRPWLRTVPWAAERSRVQVGERVVIDGEPDDQSHGVRDRGCHALRVNQPLVERDRSASQSPSSWWNSRVRFRDGLTTTR